MVKAARRTSALTGKPPLGKRIVRNWDLYLFLLLPLIYLVLFAYIPMGGIIVAFKDYRITKGIFASNWAGMKYFQQFFQAPYFWQILRNTITISLYSLVAGFPMPIILALALNELRNGNFKKFVQTITYAPYFISTVVLVGIMLQMLDLRFGAPNILLKMIGMKPINFMGIPELFQSIYVWSGVWQGTGYGAIIYIAALSGIDPSLYEAAKIDGASRFHRMLYIDLPGIMPTVVVMLILSAGGILSVGFEKIYLLQNNLNLNISEVISTYVYKVGIKEFQLSYSTAVGLFNSVVNFILLVIVNSVARRFGETSLW